MKVRDIDTRIQESIAPFRQRMEKLAADANRAAGAVNRAISDARKHADHLRKTIPRLPLPEADQYLRDNPPSALTLMILMRETPSSKGARARAKTFTAARLHAENYWREHREDIEDEGKKYHAEPLAAMISANSKFGCQIKYRTVLDWWKKLER